MTGTRVLFQKYIDGNLSDFVYEGQILGFIKKTDRNHDGRVYDEYAVFFIFDTDGVIWELPASMFKINMHFQN